MGARYSASKYSKQKESEIRFTILSALQELAAFNGIDSSTIKESSPYCFALNGVTTQKISAEIKKLIEMGMVVKGVAKGKRVKYMLRQTYEDLVKDGKISKKDFGYGDYRDEIPKPECKAEIEEEDICQRIELSATRKRYDDMWD